MGSPQATAVTKVLCGQSRCSGGAHLVAIVSRQTPTTRFGCGPQPFGTTAHARAPNSNTGFDIVTLQRFLIAGFVILIAVAGFAQNGSAGNLSYVVKVNGEPITSYDVSQRQKFKALTTGALGKRMRSLLRSDSTKRKFQEFMQQQRPSSRAEAEALQKKFVDQLQKEVMSDISKETRKGALDELIEERLMLQEAKRREVAVSDSEVDQRLTQMAKANDKDKTLEAFLSAFRAQGVDPATIRQRIRAQLAWRDVIRKLYGFRIASLVGTNGAGSDSSTDNATNTVFDVRRLRIPAAAGGQSGVARAYIRGQAIRKQFTSCGELAALAKRAANGAQIETLSGKKASSFPRDARPLLIKASQGQMLPPILSSSGVDLYAVCAKKTPKSEERTETAARSAPDRRQQEFQIYARRHLTDLRQDALIERRKDNSG